MAPPPPELMDELLGEILLRLPPDEPEHLFRAALVCKRWLRILCDRAFRRRYSAFHGVAPLLGFLQRRAVIQGDPDPRLVPTTAAPLSPYPDCRKSRALDCRHGRALLHAADVRWHLIVWDPVTGDRHRVPEPDIVWFIYSAVVFCAVPGCDHLDCHGGPFRVVFMATDDHEELVKATAYSSETGEWSVPVTLGNDCEAYLQHRKDALVAERGWHYMPYVMPRRGAVIGDETYFTLRCINAIVKYDWAKNCISMVNPPTLSVFRVVLIVMEDCSLGFACMEGSRLRLWSRKVDSEGAAEWVQCRDIELETIIPVAKPGDQPFVVGSAEGVGIIFVSTGVGLFTIKLKSGKVKKVDNPGVYFSILPYMSFYTPNHGRLLSLARSH